MNKVWGYDAIEYAETYGVPLNKYADPTEGAKEAISFEEAEEIASEDPSLIWCIVPETMVPVPLSHYVASAQFTLPGIVCPTPEFKHGQTVLWKKDWTRGRVSSVTLNSKMEFEYRVTFFGQSSEYPVPLESLIAAEETPHPQEEAFPAGTKVVLPEPGRSGQPGIILEARYNQKEGCWEHLVKFRNYHQWVDCGLLPLESEESYEL